MKNNNCSTGRLEVATANRDVHVHRAPGASPGASPPPHHRYTCDYDSLAGVLWDQRIKQHLVANGVAVVQVNPLTDDSWDAYDNDAVRTTPL